MSLTSLFPQLRRRYREMNVYVSMTRDGHRSVSIHGGSPAEVTALMHEALNRFDAPAVTALD